MSIEPSNWNDRIMKVSVFVLFSLFFFLDYLSLALGLIPRQFTWLPEVISLGIFFFIFARLFGRREIMPIVNQTQLVIFFIVLTVLGLVINRVGIPVALAGIRNNLKYLPLFFLPFFYRFDKEFIRKFLIFLFILALMQLPVTVIQRIVYETPSGDFIGGTLGARSTGILSVFLVLCLVFWSFSFIKGTLTPIVFTAGFIGLVSPLGLNETKFSFFILPVAAVCIFLFTKHRKRNIKKILVVFACFAVGAIFIGSLFNNLYVQKDIINKRVMSQKTDSSSNKEMNTYESRDFKEKKPAKFKIIRYFKPKRIMTIIYAREKKASGALNRIPQVIFAFDHIKKNPVRLLFGVGAGNASDSFFEKAHGRYHKKFGNLDIGNNFLSRMLWEYGLIGTFLFFLIFVYFFIKAWGFRNDDGIIGVTASGYLVLIVIYIMTSIYFNTMLINLFGYLFWFLGGYLLAYGYHWNKLKGADKEGS